MTVGSKSEFLDLWKRGCLGNSLMAWSNLNELCASGYKGKVNVRYTEPNSPYCRYNQSIAEAEQTISTWVSEGADRNKFYFNEIAPDEKLVIQGELMRTTESYYLFYSREKAKMRDALKNGQHASGIVAKHILEASLNESSYEDIQELLDLYPNCVIEFGAYEHCLGSCKNRNMIIWEVRSY